MGDEQPTPIEVELIGDLDVEPRMPSAAESEDLPDGVSRRAAVAGAVAAAVIAGSVGVAIGRGSVGDGSAADDAVESVAGTTTELERTGPVVETIAPVPTTVPVTAAVEEVEQEIEPPPIVTSIVRVDERLVGLDLQVVAAQGDGSWARLDLRDGTLDRIVPNGPASRAMEGGAVTGGDGWFVSRRAGDQMAAVWRDATESWELVPLGRSWRLLREASTTRFWSGDEEGFPSGTTLELFEIDGTPAGARIEVPAGAFVQATDPAGGLIIGGGGRTFAVSSEARTPIGGGELLAVTETMAVTWSCDDDLQCGIEVIDRSTGESRRLAVADDPEATTQIVGPYLFGQGDLSWPVSPDGEAVLVLAGSQFGLELGVLELDDGSFRRLGDASEPFTAAWTPDSRYFLLARGGVPLAFDRETGEAFPVDADRQLTGWIDLVALR